jgi:hypothetical protein
MEKKQPLFLILALLVLGATLASAIWVFSRNNVSSFRDMLVSEITHIAADAVQFRARAKSSGGGGGSYGGYKIPPRLRANSHAVFSATDSAGQTLVIIASSTRGLGSVSAKAGRDGAMRDVSFTGEFAE